MKKLLLVLFMLFLLFNVSHPSAYILVDQALPIIHNIGLTNC